MHAALRPRGDRHISPSRCWPGSTPATSIGCRSRALFPRLVDAERKHGSLLRAFRRQLQSAIRKPQSASSTEGAFKSLPGGPQRDGATRWSSALGARARAAEHRASTRSPAADRSPCARRRARRSRRGPSCSRRPPTSTSALLRDRDAETARLARRDPVRVGRDRRARPSRATVRASADRIRLRRPARRAHRHPRGVVAVVEVAAPRAGRSRADARRSSAARAIRRRSNARMPSSSACRSTALRPLLGINASPLLTRVYRWDRAQRAARSRAPRSHGGDRARADPPSRPVHHRQRVPRRRHTRLRGRRSRDGRASAASRG